MRKPSVRLELLLIVSAVAVMTTTLGLSAYLTDVTDPLAEQVNIRNGTEFKISISAGGFDKNKDLIPGKAVPFNPVIANEGNYDVYTFIEVDLPGDVTLDGISSDWVKVDIDEGTVYAYGHDSTLTQLDRMTKNADGTFTATETTDLCTGIALSDKTEREEEPITISVTGYAIQTDGVSGTPEDVWSLLKSEEKAAEGGATIISGSANLKDSNTGD